MFQRGRQHPDVDRLGQIGTAELWRLGGLSPREVVVRSVQGFRRHHLDARAAQFAYYSMLAVAPVLVLIIAAAAHLPVEGVLDSFVEGLGRAMPQEARDVIAQQMREIQVRSSVSLVSLALVVLGFAGSNLFLTVARGLNAAYGVVEGRRPWLVRALAVLVTFVLFLTAISVLAMLVVGPMVSQWLVEQSRLPIPRYLIYRAVRWGVVSVALLLSVSAVYALAPSVRLRWRPFTPGSVAATAGWVLASLGCRWYMASLARHQEIYGALGGVIVLMIWLYLTGSVVLLGGQIDSVIYRAAAERRTRT